MAVTRCDWCHGERHGEACVTIEGKENEPLVQLFRRKSADGGLTLRLCDDCNDKLYVGVKEIEAKGKTLD